MSAIPPEMLGKAMLEGVKQVPGLCVVAFIALQAFALFDSQSMQMSDALANQSAVIQKNTEVLTELRTLLMVHLGPIATQTETETPR